MNTKSLSITCISMLLLTACTAPLVPANSPEATAQFPQFPESQAVRTELPPARQAGASASGSVATAPAAPAASSGVDAIPEAQTRLTVGDILAQGGRFDTLIQALRAADMEQTLRSDASLTLFAPTDDAFARLPETQLQALLDNPTQLANILSYHVIPKRMIAADLMTLEQTDQTLQGGNIEITMENNDLLVDRAVVLESDRFASNGVIHVVDSVLMP